MQYGDAGARMYPAIDEVVRAREEGNISLLELWRDCLPMARTPKEVEITSAIMSSLQELGRYGDMSDDDRSDDPSHSLYIEEDDELGGEG